MTAPTRLLLVLLSVLVLLTGQDAWAEGLDLDRRRMLNAAEHAPWRAVGRVNVVGGHFTSMCTGTLIAPDVVLTAAHCLVDPSTGHPYPVGILHFVAGWRMGQKVASRGVAAVALHPAYRFGDRPGPREIAADLALIRLSEPIPPAKAEPFEVGPLRTGSPLVLISYRQDRPHALTRQEGCDVIARGVEEGPTDATSPIRGEAPASEVEAVDLDNLIALDCDVTFGASGSPLFVLDGERPRVVAVMSAMQASARERMAFAVLVEPQLERLMASLPGPRPVPAPLTAPRPAPRSAAAAKKVRASD